MIAATATLLFSTASGAIPLGASEMPYKKLVGFSIQSKLNANNKNQHEGFCDLKIDIAPDGILLRVTPKAGDAGLCKEAVKAATTLRGLLVTEGIDSLKNRAIKVILWSTKTAVSFDYGETTLTIFKVYSNTFTNCYFIDLSWNGGAKNIYAIPLRGGVNVLLQ